MDRCRFALFLIFVASLACASDATASAHPIAQANDNRLAAGELKRGTLAVQLEMVETTWYPEQESGPSLSVYAFAEKGKPPQIPGPLVRIPQGTEVRVQIHNSLPVAMFIRGLDSHDDARPEPVLIAAGATADFHFTAQSPGTYYYSARSTKMSIHEIGLLSIIEDLPMGDAPFDIESELAGGFIVDRPGAAPDDRIFIITNWIAGVITPPFREEVVINGKAWPYTERLSYRTGDTARWRLLNASINDHAMHLHGFFFEVTSLGSQDRDHLYSPDQIPHVVTQHLDPGETTSMMWTPDRPGRWLLHCHMAAHMAKQEAWQPADSHPAHATEHNSDGMGGMVLGITVSGPSRSAAPASGAKARQLQLIVRENPATRFVARSYGLRDPGSRSKRKPRSSSVPGCAPGPDSRRAHRNHGRQSTEGTDRRSLAWHRTREL